MASPQYPVLVEVESVVQLVNYKLLHKVDDMEVNYSFKGLPDTNNIRELPEHIVNQMSTDQKNCYKLLSAIQT